MSDTPETDKAAYPVSTRVRADFARKLERERDKARSILDNLDEVWHVMRPRYCGTPSMDGRYPCWIVWLPDEGKCERKTLKEAVLEFTEQSAARGDTSQRTTNVHPPRHDE
jgi:hypothetical protein